MIIILISTLIGLGLLATTVGAGAYGISRYADMQQQSLNQTGSPIMDITQWQPIKSGDSFTSSLMALLPFLLMIPMMGMMK